ncbi:MAG: family 78 glycoside hydrolase catalytic domain [Clostridia bacterium]|nr:family 78 glycoside hydrolase catalytic domain [Clostridia bacterium]
MFDANWIYCSEPVGDTCFYYKKGFSLKEKPASVTLFASAKGVYEASLNGKRVGDYILAPGRTDYQKRIQYQSYDVTDLVGEQNELIFLVAEGWCCGRVSYDVRMPRPELIAKLKIEYSDGTYETIYTDDTWIAAKSGFSSYKIWDGFVFDARIKPDFCLKTAISDDNNKTLLVPQQGEKIVEHERLAALEIIHTPKGETVIDFGQNMTGYVEIKLNAKAGDRVSLSFGEILDKEGNFYNENYRSAQCNYNYTCREGKQTFKPTLTFYGFRYIRIDRFPGEPSYDNFTAIAVYSDMKRTGHIETSDPMLNQLFHNIIWGQRGNFLDIPTDCPQRDERQGWTGDAQIFIKAASYNYDVKKFFRKWLRDMRFGQREDGAVGEVIPNVWGVKPCAAWADAVTICPWQLYLTYADREILEEMFPAMKKWVNYVIGATTKENLWFGGWHYGDWLELGAPYGNYKGATRDDLLASAYHAKSTELVIKAGKVLCEDVSFYEKHYEKVVQAFREEFSEDYKTQTEYVLALYFNLTATPKETAAKLVELIHKDGDKIQTGFVGTPYILHVLSSFGYNELAYKLMLRKEYPSWLYPITKGATTVWEHWDGIMPNGDLWPIKMNSYNHYAYGSVADWLYGVAAGINTVEEKPGFAAVHFAPVADSRIEWFKGEIETAHGTVKSGWKHEGERVVYEITTPVAATADIAGKHYNLDPGTHIFTA